MHYFQQNWRWFWIPEPAFNLPELSLGSQSKVRLTPFTTSLQLPYFAITLSSACLQAITNTLLSKVHLKKKAGFKPTDKTQNVNPALQIQTAFMSRLTSITRRFNQAQLPQLYEPQVQPAGMQGPGVSGSLLK